MDRSKLAAGGLLVAVFAAGLIVGGAGSAALGGREQRGEREERTPYIEVLQDSLGLSPDQREQVNSALEEFYTNYSAMSKELRDEEKKRFREISLDARSKINAALDGTQAEVYRRMLARTDSIRAERANRRRR